MKDKTKALVIVMLFLLVLSSLAYSVLAEDKDSDLDGIIDSEDKYPFDYDNDGMPDIWEKKNGLRYDTNDANGDADSDGIKNIDEYKQGSNPMVSDKTLEKAQPTELAAPAEGTAIPGMVWAAAAVFAVLVVIFILYRFHILRMFKPIHRARRERPEGERAGPRAPVSPKQTMPSTMQSYHGVVFQPRIVSQPVRSMPAQIHPHVVPRAAIPKAGETTPNEWERMLERRRSAWGRRYALKPFAGEGKVSGVRAGREEQTWKEEQTGKEIPDMSDIYIPIEELQKKLEKEEPFGKLSEHIKKKGTGNAFERLAEHIHDYRRLEQHRYGRDNFKRLAEIKARR